MAQRLGRVTKRAHVPHFSRAPTTASNSFTQHSSPAAFVAAPGEGGTEGTPPGRQGLCSPGQPRVIGSAPRLCCWASRAAAACSLRHIYYSVYCVVSICLRLCLLPFDPFLAPWMAGVTENESRQGLVGLSDFPPYPVSPFFPLPMPLLPMSPFPSLLHCFPSLPYLHFLMSFSSLALLNSLLSTLLYSPINACTVTFIFSPHPFPRLMHPSSSLLLLSTLLLTPLPPCPLYTSSFFIPSFHPILS